MNNDDEKYGTSDDAVEKTKTGLPAANEKAEAQESQEPNSPSVEQNVPEPEDTPDNATTIGIP